MITVPFSKARSHLTDLVNTVAYAKKRIILTKKGKKVAAIISIKDLEFLISKATNYTDFPKNGISQKESFDLTDKK